MTEPNLLQQNVVTLRKQLDAAAADNERLKAAMQESLRQIHLSHPQEPGCMPGCGPLHAALLG